MPQYYCVEVTVVYPYSSSFRFFIYVNYLIAPHGAKVFVNTQVGGASSNAVPLRVYVWVCATVVIVAVAKAQLG